MPTPKGFSSVNTYIIVEDADEYIGFLVAAFGAQELGRTIHDGRIANARIQIDESIIMVSEATEQYPATYGMFYLYVDDVDATYKKAVASGAKSILEPVDMPYGDRQGIIKDRAGNIWTPSTRFSDEQFNA